MKKEEQKFVECFSEFIAFCVKSLEEKKKSDTITYVLPKSEIEKEPRLNSDGIFRPPESDEFADNFAASLAENMLKNMDDQKPLTFPNVPSGVFEKTETLEYIVNDAYVCFKKLEEKLAPFMSIECAECVGEQVEPTPQTEYGKYLNKIYIDIMKFHTLIKNTINSIKI